MELKNDKILGTHASCTNAISRSFFNRYSKFQDYNIVYQLVNDVRCIHIHVNRRATGDILVHRCAKLEELKETLEKYFIHDSDGFVLVYVTGDDVATIESAVESLMENTRTCYVYGVEDVSTLRGKICVLKNTKVFEVKNQKEYDALNLETDHINIVTHVVPRRWLIVLCNYASFGVACACWTFSVFTAYLFWWMSFYSFVFVGTMCMYAYNYLGHDNRQIFKTTEPFIRRHQSIFLTNFYEA